MKRSGTLLALVLLTMSLSAQTDPAPAPAPKEPKEWTILVLLDGPADLETLTAGLPSLAPPGSKPWTLVVQVCRPGTKRQILVGTKLQNAPGSFDQAPLTAAALADFVGWGLRTYPAKKTALLAAGAGSGRQGFGWDPASGKTLTLTDLREGLAAGLKASGTKRLDLVAFNAPLMASFETARALAPSARWLLGTPDFGPGGGWNPAALGQLNTSAAMTPGALAAALGAVRTIDLDKVANVEGALKAWASGAQPRIGTLADAFVRARSAAPVFGVTGEPAWDEAMVDLEALARGWKSIPEWVGTAQRLEAAARDAGGLTLWFPGDPARAIEASDAEVPAWTALLKAWSDGAAGREPPTLTVGQDNVDSGVGLGDSGVTFTRPFATPTLDSAATVRLAYGTVDAWGAPRLLGTRVAEARNGTVTGQWDGRAWVFTQGAETMPAYAAETTSATGAPAWVLPFSAWVEGETPNRVWAWAAEETSELSWWIQLTPGMVVRWKPNPQATLVSRTPQRMRTGSWVGIDRGTGLDPAQPWKVSRTTVLPGRIVLALEVADGSGNVQSQEYEGNPAVRAAFVLRQFSFR